MQPSCALGGTWGLDLHLQGGAWSERPDLLFSLHSFIESAGSFSLRWEEGTLAQLPAASSGDPAALAHTLRGLASLRFPQDTLNSTREYLRRFRHCHPLIAVSTEVAGAGEEDSFHGALWSGFFQALHGALPQALFLVVNRLGDGNRPSFPSYVRIVQDVGFGVVEGLALAQQAHAFFGGCDAYGAMAWAAELPGVYVTSQQEDSAGTAAQVGSRMRCAASAMFEEGPGKLRASLQASPPTAFDDADAFTKSPRDAAGFLKIWDGRDLVIALNPIGAEAAAVGTSGIAQAMELAAHITAGRPDAVICLLACSENELADVPDTSALWTHVDFGASPADCAMLARCADVYVGVMDQYGQLAMRSRRPGVYARYGFGDGTRASAAEAVAADRLLPLQWITERLDDPDCSTLLRNLAVTLSCRQ